jgi:hypothetical protein
MNDFTVKVKISSDITCRSRLREWDSWLRVPLAHPGAQVVQWTANPNPRSKNPTQNTQLPRPFEAPKAVGLDAGALLPAPVGPKAPVVGAPVGPPAVQSPVVVDGMDPSRGIDFSFN